MSTELVKLSNHLILCPHFSFCPQSFPAPGSFPVSWLFASGDQSIRASSSASILPMNIQGWFPLGLSGLISLQSKGLSRVFSDSSKASILCHSAFFTVQLSCTSIHDHWKNYSFDRMELCWQSDVSVLWKGWGMYCLYICVHVCLWHLAQDAIQWVVNS